MQERLRILVVGSGGREHALAWRLSKSPLVDLIHVAPGNGGTKKESEKDDAKILNVPIDVDKFTELVAHARKHGLNLVVVGPEAPLVDGIEAHFRAVGIRCFGPSKAAARMEGSKVFAKDFMRRHNIPTAAYRAFAKYDDAKEYLDSVHHDVVIKADGLAMGKGVFIPQNKKEADDALKQIMIAREFGNAGDEVVVEEFLDGDELSILTFSDGYSIRSLPPAQDHKRVFDGDKGPNTGGMGCYAPARVAWKELMTEIDNTIVRPTIDGLRRDGMPFVGILFTGLMMTKSGPKVLEYNVRGGDPETQTLLPLLSDDTDLAKVMLACTEHWLDGVNLKITSDFAATVVACAEGYPGKYARNREIHAKETGNHIHIFHAGTSVEEKKLLTKYGRVIATTAVASTLEEAVTRAYQGMEKIKFEGMHFRKDIAHRALARKDADHDKPLTYAAAGVSIDSGNDLVSRIKSAVKATSRPGADAIIGGFGGAFDLSKASRDHKSPSYDTKSPTIIGAIDGVGTKLKIAYAMNKHDTVGIDLVAMNVNDLIVQGAEPLIFLDCYTCSKLDVDVAADAIRGIAQGCKISGCALVGGETAEMPGLLSGTEYDLVGCAIGAVNTAAGKRILPDMGRMAEGDVLLGLASSGVHSNGFSLVRRIIERRHLDLTEYAPWDPDHMVGESLLEPTRIYVLPLLKVIERDLVNGMAHITGGGLIENVPRMLPEELMAEIDVSTWKRPKVFDWLQREGGVSDHEMSRTFNNGIGMVVAVSNIASGEVKKELEAQGETVYKIGKLRKRAAGEEGCKLLNLEKWSSKTGKV